VKYVSTNQINWPVAEPGDFDTRDGGVHFTVMEDEDGETYFAYGHVPEPQMHAEVTRYLNHMIPSGDFDEIGEPARHVYAKYVDTYAERFSWDGVTSETPHAFPMTLVSF
jgi:hypothetical protein